MPAPARAGNDLYYRATPAFDRLALRGCDGTIFHIRKRDHRPDGLAFVFQGVNFRHAGRDGISELIEHRLHIADLRP